MSLRSRVHAIIACSAVVLVLAAVWQITAYEFAREKVSQAVADSITLDEAGTRLSETLIFSLLLDMVLLFLAWRYLRRWVLDPLDEIRDQLKVVADGQLHSVITLDRPDELRAAARDAEIMRQHLVAQIDQKRAAFESLNAQAPLALSMKAALEPNSITIPNLDIFGAVDPAQGVIAGDWWDVVKVPDGVAVVAADVAGHGPAAGVAGLHMKAIITSGLSSGLAATELLERVSSGLSSIDSLTATVAICVIPDDVTRDATFVSAGHPPGRLIRHDGSVENLDSTGPMLGALGTLWAQHTFRFAAGERILLYSDGLVETRDGNGDEFALTRVDSALIKGRDENSHTLGNQILSQARKFSTTWNHDDVSIVVITRRLSV